MSYIATFLRGAIIGLLVAFICHYAKNEPHKPDTFQCPHCGTTLQWTDDELWRGYIECRSGWTAAAPNQVTPNDEWVYTVPTNAGRKVEAMWPEWGRPE